MNPLKPEFQEITVLHYRIVLSKLIDTDEVKKFQNKATCYAMCSPDEVYNRAEVEAGAKYNFELRPDGSLFE